MVERSTLGDEGALGPGNVVELPFQPDPTSQEIEWGKRAVVLEVIPPDRVELAHIRTVNGEVVLSQPSTVHLPVQRVPGERWTLRAIVVAMGRNETMSSLGEAAIKSSLEAGFGSPAIPYTDRAETFS